MCVQLEDAVVLSQSVVSMGEEAGDFLPRAYLALGLCYSLKASEGKDTQTPSSHHHALVEMPKSTLEAGQILGHFGNVLVTCVKPLCSSPATLRADRNEFNKKALRALSK